MEACSRAEEQGDAGRGLSGHDWGSAARQQQQQVTSYIEDKCHHPQTALGQEGFVRTAPGEEGGAEVTPGLLGCVTSHQGGFIRGSGQKAFVDVAASIAGMCAAENDGPFSSSSSSDGVGGSSSRAASQCGSSQAADHVELLAGWPICAKS